MGGSGQRNGCGLDGTLLSWAAGQSWLQQLQGLLCSDWVWPLVLCSWEHCLDSKPGYMQRVGDRRETLTLAPLAERRVLGPDAGVQARVPVQVTKNRPLGTCTAYPGLLERGHVLRQGLGPPAFAPSFPREFLISALGVPRGCPLPKRRGWGSLEGTPTR